MVLHASGRSASHREHMGLGPGELVGWGVWEDRVLQAVALGLKELEQEAWDRRALRVGTG